ncbi:MAG: hypothetical protein ACPHL6_05980 [Rubripirellula sp.]
MLKGRNHHLIFVWQSEDFLTKVVHVWLMGLMIGDGFTNDRRWQEGLIEIRELLVVE